MHPFFYLEIAHQHTDELLAEAERHRLRRWIRRHRHEADNVHALLPRPGPLPTVRASAPSADAA